MTQARIQTRLCPHCANSIGADALTCPYCKADLMEGEPEWPARGGIEPPISAPEKQKLTVKSKAILALGLLVFALGIYLVGGNVERHDLDNVLAEQRKTLRERDQKIQSLEAQLAELRKKNHGGAQEAEEIKTRLEESQKSLVAAQRKLASANKEIERLSSTRVAPAVRPTSRRVDPQAQRSAAPVKARMEPRTYEAVRSTQVYEEPASSARVVAQLTKGTQVTVVGSGDGWLEIRSRHGKPPGFIRADDAMFISRAN
jgi:Bacterial SH3 domain